MKECVFCAINCVVLLLGIKNECAARVDRCPQCLECAQRLQVRLRSWLVEGPARKVVRRVREGQSEDSPTIDLPGDERRSFDRATQVAAVVYSLIPLSLGGDA